MEAAFDEQSKLDTEQMMDDVLTTFADQILDEQNDWMDDVTKAEAHKKIDALVSFIGYPDYIINDTPKMDEQYIAL